jgi:hypothetical protein
MTIIIQDDLTNYIDTQGSRMHAVVILREDQGARVYHTQLFL